MENEEPLICPKCGAHCSFSEQVLVRSSVCGHGVCGKCLSAHAPVRVSATSGELVWSGQESETAQVVDCPVCNVGAPPRCWSSRREERNVAQRCGQVRKRVFQILNCDRASFATTPEYNDFLEQREQIVYDLVYEKQTDPSLSSSLYGKPSGPKLSERRREIDEFLAQCDTTHQKIALEATARQKRRMEERIKTIVEREGTFYEQLRLNFKRGFVPYRRSPVIQPINEASQPDDEQDKDGKTGKADSAQKTTLGAAAPLDLSTLTHPLQREHEALFAEALPNDVAATMTGHTDLLLFLRSRLPAVMNDYHPPTDLPPSLRAVAGGFSKKVINQKVQIEALAIRIGISTVDD